MEYLERKITASILHTLRRGKSVLFLGPRQTGKTTLIANAIPADISYTLIKPDLRMRYEKNPALLSQEIQAQITAKKLISPVVVIDEVQKVPAVLDVVQDLIDQQIARFVLTGSSSRKLKHGANINLLPGRVVLHHLDPLMLTELLPALPSLETLLLYGSLPGILAVADNADKNSDLHTYVTTYLEDEIRAEAAVRHIAPFARFLQLAASEAGQLINYSQMSQAIGVAHTTIAAYYQLLEDSLIVERVEPLCETRLRKRLAKAPKFIFFDLGVRRLCAEEGIDPPLHHLGKLFEQFVGIELIRQARQQIKPIKIAYWRSHDGPEVDYVIQQEKHFIPIEVKLTEAPTNKHIRHLEFFLQEYPHSKHAYLICQTPKRLHLTPQITALPWQEIYEIMGEL